MRALPGIVAVLSHIGESRRRPTCTVNWVLLRLAIRYRESTAKKSGSAPKRSPTWAFKVRKCLFLFFLGRFLSLLRCLPFGRRFLGLFRRRLLCSCFLRLRRRLLGR